MTIPDMETVMRPFIGVVLGLLLNLSVAEAKPTFEKTGEIKISRVDFKIDGDNLVASFRATRWGMYDLTYEGASDSQIEVTLNGQKPVEEPSLMQGHLGKFYIKKAGPCSIQLSGTAPGVKVLRLAPACEGSPVVQEGGQAIELDARNCRISGVMLRYEPNPKKLCIGFWGNPDDYPVWNYAVATAGKYEVVLTQGCGRGAGGSRAVLETAGTSLEFTVKDTGGYQNWIDVSLGEVDIAKPGDQELTVKVLKKARGIMDIRRIVLKPVR